MWAVISRNPVLPRSGARCPRPGPQRSGLEQQTKDRNKNILEIRTNIRVDKKHIARDIDPKNPKPPKHNKTVLNNLNLQDSTYIYNIHR